MCKSLANHHLKKPFPCINANRNKAKHKGKGKNLEFFMGLYNFFAGKKTSIKFGV